MWPQQTTYFEVCYPNWQVVNIYVSNGGNKNNLCYKSNGLRNHGSTKPRLPRDFEYTYEL